MEVHLEGAPQDTQSSPDQVLRSVPVHPSLDSRCSSCFCEDSHVTTNINYEATTRTETGAAPPPSWTGDIIRSRCDQEVEPQDPTQSKKNKTHLK